MLCERCRKNTATVSIMLNINGRVSSANLCDECAAFAAMHAAPNPAPAAWAMPADAEKSIRARRKLNELHAQMKTAINRENYEEAARIRDALSKMESEVHVYE